MSSLEVKIFYECLHTDSASLRRGLKKRLYFPLLGGISNIFLMKVHPPSTLKFFESVESSNKTCIVYRPEFVEIKTPPSFLRRD